MLKLNLAKWWRRERKPEPREKSASEQLVDALKELQYTREGRQRRHPGKQRHTDDYRELVVDGAEKVSFAEALLDLTRESRAAQQESEAHPRTELRSRASTDEATRLEAERAAREMKEQMEAQGYTPPEHYYTPSERIETGEVDRTYVIRKEEKRPRRPRGRR